MRFFCKHSLFIIGRQLNHVNLVYKRQKGINKLDTIGLFELSKYNFDLNVSQKLWLAQNTFFINKTIYTQRKLWWHLWVTLNMIPLISTSLIDRIMSCSTLSFKYVTKKKKKNKTTYIHNQYWNLHQWYISFVFMVGCNSTELWTLYCSVPVVDFAGLHFFKLGLVFSKFPIYMIGTFEFNLVPVY